MVLCENIFKYISYSKNYRMGKQITGIQDITRFPSNVRYKKCSF